MIRFLKGVFNVCRFETLYKISLYNNLHRPSRLAAGADLHCFKNRIEPKWEDPVCAHGGKWTMTFPKSKSDTCWLYTVLYLCILTIMFS